MSAVSVPRLGRLMLNDLLGSARSIAYGTLGVLSFTLTCYLLRYAKPKSPDVMFDQVIFGFCLIIGGLLVTGMAFQDLHHPHGRNQYLMLPVSNLERILSRYLLTGPLVLIYAFAAFAFCDFAVKQLVAIWFDQHRSLFMPFTPVVKWLVFSYLMAHLVVLIGAICFRSHALLKSIGFMLLLIFCLVLVENLMGRIFFPGDYSWSQFTSVHPSKIELIPWFAAGWMNVVLVVAIFLWMFYVAYLCLRDHEV